MTGDCKVIWLARLRRLRGRDGDVPARLRSLRASVCFSMAVCRRRGSVMSHSAHPR